MTTQLLEKLISIPSFSREEAAAADYLYSRLWGEGLNPHRKGNNIWCECGSGSSTVLLNAHIDTVKPCGGWTLNPFEPVLEGDKLFGLGSNDDGWRPSRHFRKSNSPTGLYFPLPRRKKFPAPADWNSCSRKSAPSTMQ